MTTGPALAQPCSTLDHLEWTLATDWSCFSGGQPLRDGWLERATAWRADRPDTPAWTAQLNAASSPSWAALQTAHARAGLDPRFRTGPAFCRDRRYGWYPGLADRFARKLDLDAGDGSPPIARAIRGFLDICHIHPFADGNARAACSWMVWTLLEANVDVPDLAGLMRLPKPVGNDRVPEVMARLLS